MSTLPEIEADIGATVENAPFFSVRREWAAAIRKERLELAGMLIPLCPYGGKAPFKCNCSACAIRFRLEGPDA